MMIMRFHRLIQSRLLWIFFLGIVVISFVVMQAASGSGAGNPAIARLREAVGHINGSPVSFQRFDSTRRILSRSSNRRMSSNELDQMVWDRLTLLAYAQSCGLETPISLARRQFIVQFTGEDGQVDPTRIQNFRLDLRRDNLSEEDYVRFIQEDMTLRSLQNAFGTHSLVPAFDAERWAMLQSDRFEIEYAVVGEDQLRSPVEVSEEQLQTFYGENGDRFTIPEKRIVRYIALPLSAFTEGLKAPTEAEAQAEYDANPDRYTRFVPTPEGQEPKREPIPFAEAKDGILTQLANKAAQSVAEETAMSYTVRLTPRRGRPAATLEQIAKEASAEIVTTPAFSAREPLPGIRNAWAFVRAAFELDETPIGRNGQPVVSPDAVYVMQLQEIIPSRPSQLEEVRVDVATAATNHFRRIALNTLATNLVTEIKTETAKGVPFKDAAASRGLSVTQAPPFQMKDINPNSPTLPPGLPEAATAAGAGEVFGPVESMFGGLHIGHVLTRTPVPEDAATLRGQLQSQLGPYIQFRGFFERFRAMVLRDGLKIANEKADGETPPADAGV